MRKLKGTTKSNGRKQTNDKFYTAKHVAEQCLAKLDLSTFVHIIEPSAGSGVFSTQIPNCIALDIQPENPTITKQDFLTYQPNNFTGETLVVGNPPFGVQNNLAIKFFNHAATFADCIAFILPKSFRKESIKNKLNPHFVLKEEIILNKNSFELNGNPYDVPSVFQIWVKTSTPRKIVTPPQSTQIKFVKKQQTPDFYIQRIGGNAGKVGYAVETRSEQSNYFIKIENIQIREKIYNFLNTYNWDEIRKNTVGPRSISKTEILKVLHKKFPELF